MTYAYPCTKCGSYYVGSVCSHCNAPRRGTGAGEARPHYDMYVWGECLKQDRPGGWATILRSGEEKKLLKGAEDATTRERTVLLGLLMGHRNIPHPAHLDAYLPKKMTAIRLAKGITGGESENGELWKEIKDLSKCHALTYHAEAEGRWMDWAKRSARCALLGVKVSGLLSEEDIERLGGPVTNKEASGFWISANESGYSKLAGRRLLYEYGVISAKDIPKRRYQELLDRASSEAIAEVYNRQEKAHV